MRGEYYDKQIDGIDDFRLTPACAGNTHNIQTVCAGYRAHPRMRGEYGKIFGFQALLPGSPPHARGIPTYVVTFLGYSRLTPACAGNTLK